MTTRRCTTCLASGDKKNRRILRVTSYPNLTGPSLARARKNRPRKRGCGSSNTYGMGQTVAGLIAPIRYSPDYPVSGSWTRSGR
jgi:hypothetical protein